MSIDFSKDRWEELRDTYRRWWNGTLGRPLFCFSKYSKPPNRPEPKLQGAGFTAAYGLDTPADQIVDRWDYDLSCQEFIGDSYPRVWPNFGAGVIAAYLGANLHYDPQAQTSWFHPKTYQEVSDIHFSYCNDSPWLQRTKEICRVAAERWQGSVQIGMTDLGGNLDIVSSFRPSERLLFDLYDNPEEVKRLTWEAHDMWFRYYQEIDSIIRPFNPGYSAWPMLFSPDPYYMLQCDFCYMISPDMFDEFVKPELAAACKRLNNPFYHLDGPGQLPHLDSLLEIKELKGIQWIPGAGQPDHEHWPEVFRKIRKAGKLIELHASRPETIEIVVEQLGGDASGIFFTGWLGLNEETELRLRAIMKKYGA